MRHIAIAAAIAALLGAAPTTQAAPPPAEACCACVMSAPCLPTDGTAMGALFCAASPPGNRTALEESCAGLAPEGGLLCLEDGMPGTPCREQLAARGIVCPAAGVPAADPLNLAALAVVLAALGAVLVRHRTRSRT